MTTDLLQAIALYRHGKVRFDGWKWTSPEKFRQLVVAYDNGPIVVPNKRSPQATPGWIVVSTLPRSVASAHVLFGGHDFKSDLFREAELPTLPAIPVVLPTIAWFVVSRLLWRFGRRTDCEGYSDFKSRAALATDILIDHCSDGKSVALVGHALLNREIARELRKRGFHGPHNPSQSYWVPSIFRRSNRVDT